MAANPIQQVAFNPLDPNSADLAKAMMMLQAQQQNAQGMADDGSQMPDPNEMIPGNNYAPAQVVKQSPLLYASKALEKGLGTYQNMKLMQKQLDLQQAMAQRNFGLLNSALGGSPSPQQLGAALQPTSGAGGMPMPMRTNTPYNNLTAAMIQQESGGNPNAVSPKGAAGVAQIMPATAHDPGFGVRPLQSWDGKDPRTAPVPEQIRFMSDYEGAMQNRYPGNPAAAIGAYNAGPGTMDKVMAGQQQLPAETAHYIPSVMQKAGMPEQANVFQKALAMRMAGMPDEVVKQWLAVNAPAPTPDMINAQASGATSPLDYENQKAVAAAQIQQGIVPGTQQSAPGAPGVNQPVLKTPEQLAGEKKLAEDKAEATAEAAKTMNVTTANLPAAIKRFQEMRGYADQASSGLGVSNDGKGWAQEMWNTLGGEKDKANTALAQREAQGILPELGPALAQAGIKGNKFLETLSSQASGLDLAASPEAKINLINGLESQYISNLKSAAAQLRNSGQPAPSDSDIDAMVESQRSQIRSSPLQQPQSAQPSQYQEGMTATNPKTGQKLIFKGGQWLAQ